MDQYYEWKQLDPGFTEAEIVFRIFSKWYLNPHKEYSSVQKNRIQRYLESDFYPTNILELSLVALDIDRNINPGSIQNFDATVNIVKEMMINYDYLKEQSNIQNPFKPELIGSKIASARASDFTVKWHNSFHYT